MNNKSLIKTLILNLGLFCSLNAQADVLGNSVAAGASFWYTDMSLAPSDNDKIKENNNAHGFVWAKIEHIVPILPNFKARYNYLEENAKDYDYGMNHFDLTAYYELVDITPVTLDLGIGTKAGPMEVKHKETNTYADYKNFIPYVYGAGRLELVPTSFAINAELMGSNIEFWRDTRMLDGQIGVSYTIGDAILQFEGEVGYRYMMLNQDVGPGQVKTEIKGPFAGISLKF